MQSQLLDAQRSLSNAVAVVGKASKDEKARWAQHEEDLKAHLHAEQERIVAAQKEATEAQIQAAVLDATKPLHDSLAEAKQREHEAVWTARNQLESQKDQVSFSVCHFWSLSKCFTPCSVMYRSLSCCAM